MVAAGPSGDRPKTAVAIDLLVLLAVAVAVYGFLLERDAFPYSKHSDLLSYAWASKSVLFHAIRDGTGLPFWRDDQLSGSVAMTQPQSLYLYPLHALYWRLPPLAAAGPTMWFELLLAGVGAYLLGASLGLSRAVRLFMGVTHLASFKLLMAVYAGWVPVLPAFSLLPWFLAALLHFAQRRTLAAFLGLAGVSSLAFQAGTLQPFYYAGLSMAPWLLWRSIVHGRDGEWWSTAALLGGVAGAATLGLATSAHIWLPVALDLPLLSRGELTFEFFESGNGVALRDLRTLLDPEALGIRGTGTQERGHWTRSAYFGIPPLILAVAGAGFGRPRGLARYLAVAVVATLALPFDTPVLHALHAHLPGFAIFRIPARVFWLTNVLVIALAGIGAQALVDALGDRRRIAAAALAICASIGVMEGAVRARQYIEMMPTEALDLYLPLAETFERSGEPYRVVADFPLVHGFGPTLGIDLITGYEPYSFAHSRRYIGRLVTGRDLPPWPDTLVPVRHIKRVDLLDALNTRYYITHRAVTDLPVGWRERGSWQPSPAFEDSVFSVPKLTVFERGAPLRRVFLTKGVHEVAPNRSARALERFDLRNTAIVESPLPLTPSPDPSDRVGAIAARAGFLAFEASTRGPRLAVVSEVWHPGWRATLDGQDTPLYRADHALMGILLPPGDHDVELRFRQPGFDIGVAITLAASCFAIGLCLFAWRSHTVGLSERA